jgi:hypothetical protein
MELPKRSELPNYCKVIARPINAQAIEEKLDRMGYGCRFCYLGSPQVQFRCALFCVGSSWRCFVAEFVPLMVCLFCDLICGEAFRVSYFSLIDADICWCSWFLLGCCFAIQFEKLRSTLVSLVEVSFEVLHESLQEWQCRSMKGAMVCFESCLRLCSGAISGAAIRRCRPCVLYFGEVDIFPHVYPTYLGASGGGQAPHWEH